MRVYIDDRIKRLWEGYERDLSKYIGVRGPAESLSGLLSYGNSDCLFVPIYDGNLVGFLIVGTGESCHPDCDYYIAESYIEEDSRNKGIMSTEFGKFLDSHPGTYCLDVFHENKDGKRFWERVFKEKGYKKTNFPYIEHGVDRAKTEMIYYKK